MKIRDFAALPILMILCACASAPTKTVSNTSAPDDVRGVIMTPATDLNLDKVEIPDYLKALKRGYETPLQTCASAVAEVQKIDGLIGPDITEEMTKSEKRKNSALGASSSVVGMVIPFRGLVREVSGASKRELEVRRAYERGVARRAFLKGAMSSRGCAN